MSLRSEHARRFWTDEEILIVRALYPGTKTARIAQQLSRPTSAVYQAAVKLGLHKSEEYLASPEACRLRRGEHPGLATQFKKGQVPVNKGMRRPGWAPGRMRETQFKPGRRQGAAAGNWRPLGTIAVDAEGYRRIKVREGKKGEAYGFGNTKIWPLLQRHNWEQAFGPIPDGHTVVFKDGDRSNCDVGNLEMISRAELMKRNTIHNRYPKDVVNTIMLLGAVKRKLRERNAKEYDDRSAQPPV
jgi:hypothetical protein